MALMITHKDSVLWVAHKDSVLWVVRKDSSLWVMHGDSVHGWCAKTVRLHDAQRQCAYMVHKDSAC
jgi:hypothetical protein